MVSQVKLSFLMVLVIVLVAVVAAHEGHHHDLAPVEPPSSHASRLNNHHAVITGIFPLLLTLLIARERLWKLSVCYISFFCLCLLILLWTHAFHILVLFLLSADFNKLRSDVIIQYTQCFSWFIWNCNFFVSIIFHVLNIEMGQFKDVFVCIISSSNLAQWRLYKGKYFLINNHLKAWF